MLKAKQRSIKSLPKQKKSKPDPDRTTKINCSSYLKEYLKRTNSLKNSEHSQPNLDEHQELQ